MNIGMLWFDGDQSRSLDERIQRAAAYYHHKYGRAPNLCFIHPQCTAADQSAALAGLRVKPSASVMPDHFWIGLEDQPA
jgi:hypothetical protein